MNQIHVRVHDYKTEITEKHREDFFFIVIMSVKSRNDKRRNRNNEGES